MMAKGKIAGLVVAAGTGSRAGLGIPKQFQSVAGVPMLRHSVKALSSHPMIAVICVVVGANQEQQARQALGGLPDVLYTTGGATRQDSVKNGLDCIQAVANCDAVLIHDAARPFVPPHVVDSLIAALNDHSGAVPALPVVDSLARSADGLCLSASESRDGLWRIQTPQAFRMDAICNAHQQWPAHAEASDDARMAMAAGYDVVLVAGDERLAKYTFASDFDADTPQDAAMMIVRTGSGYDVHRLVAGEELWLCGVQIEHDKGLSGHSDADVALHALTDAILGAAALGDIGDHFPPSDPQWRGASSDRFLRHAAHLVGEKGYTLSNVDVTIICEAPKIGPHRDAMQRRVSAILQIPIDAVSVKATTTERLGFTGRGEGIAAQAVATLIKENRHAN